jgi:hypothetical protein
VVAKPLVGLFVAAAMVPALPDFAQPGGVTLWFTFNAVQLAWVAEVCWRRTGLPYATAAMLLGSTASAIIAVLAWEGHRSNAIPVASFILLVMVGAAAGLCFLIESHVHRAEWTAWRADQEDKRLWDFLSGRHIPYLRRDGR